MKKYLQKLDVLGLLLLVAAAIWYSVSNVWEKWNLGLAIAGTAILIVGIIANYKQIIGSLGKRSSKYASKSGVKSGYIVREYPVGGKHEVQYDTEASAFTGTSFRWRHFWLPETPGIK